jgi:LPXTG-site transpeptidase (sortase) family protein
MKKFLNSKFLATIGILGAIFLGSQAFIYYTYYTDTQLARAMEESLYYIDALDGEIENHNNPEVTIPENTPPTESLNAPSVIAEQRQGPDRLIIDKLGINAYVQYVGLARSGNMAVPTNFKDVGWYKLGPEPGEAGNAIIAGHLDNALGLPGVFKKLDQLEPGDIIKLRNGDGSTLQFKVASKKTYSYNNSDTSEVFASGGEKRLVLITCGGNWLQGERSYDERLVVFADLM